MFEVQGFSGFTINARVHVKVEWQKIPNLPEMDDDNGRPFKVQNVYYSNDGALPLDADLDKIVASVSGRVVRADGELGSLTRGRKARVEELPDALRIAMLAELKRIRRVQLMAADPHDG